MPRNFCSAPGGPVLPFTAGPLGSDISYRSGSGKLETAFKSLESLGAGFFFQGFTD